MSILSPRLQLRVAQKQILTPGLVQMVTVLQLNRLELRDMISQEMAENPVLEETSEAGDDLTPEEVQQILEREARSDPADSSILDAMNDGVGRMDVDVTDGLPDGIADGAADGILAASAATTAEPIASPDAETTEPRVD